MNPKESETVYDNIELYI